MLELEVLIGELVRQNLPEVVRSVTHLVSVDGLSTGTVTLGEITSLSPAESACTSKRSRERAYMKFLMTRWKPDPSYPNPRSPPSAVFPVQRALKFSTVLGTVLPSQLSLYTWVRPAYFPYNPMTTLPIGFPPCSISK